MYLLYWIILVSVQTQGRPFEASASHASLYIYIDDTTVMDLQIVDNYLEGFG